MSARPAVTSEKYISRHSIAHCGDGYQVTFFCALCGYHITIGEIMTESEGEALISCEKLARKPFNGCRKCFRWVCDEHFNMGKMICVECETAISKRKPHIIQRFKAINE